MTQATAKDFLRERQRAAQGRWDRARKDERVRVAVQVGHCSDSVGAGDVAEFLSGSLPETAYMVTAGCDGACFEAPQVVTAYPSGAKRWYSRVDIEGAKRIVADVKAGTDPQPGDGDRGSHPFFAGQHRVVLDLCGELDSTELDDYLRVGGYGGLRRALSMAPEEVIEEVNASGLRGRGGAYFPAAQKWEAARAVNKTTRYLVVNSEEGEPGVYKDRHIMEGAPHRLVEGAAIAAYASGAQRAVIYINAEPEISAHRVERAVRQATDLGLLGDNIMGSGFDLTTEIRRGAGGYICGEETTLLNTIEGRRREPRLRPPFPTEAGLWDAPTVINNAETVATVPYILSRGAGALANIGTETSRGTKIISLSGAVLRPGVAEVPLGTTLRQLVYGIGGGPPGGQELRCIAVGGPSSGVLPLSMLDTAIGPGALHETGVILGAGGVIAVGEQVGVLEVVRALASYNSAESCGKCTPCREGTPRMVDALDRLRTGGSPTGDVEELRYLSEVVGLASLCGLGQAAGTPIVSALHFFGDELVS